MLNTKHCFSFTSCLGDPGQKNLIMELVWTLDQEQVVPSFIRRRGRSAPCRLNFGESEAQLVGLGMGGVTWSPLCVIFICSHLVRAHWTSWSIRCLYPDLRLNTFLSELLFRVIVWMRKEGGTTNLGPCYIYAINWQTGHQFRGAMVQSHDIQLTG